MLVFNYYYNAYEELDVYTIDNGNGTTSSNVALIVGASIGGFFGLVLVCFCIIFWYNVFCGESETQEVEIVEQTINVEGNEVIYPEGFNPNVPPP